MGRIIVTVVLAVVLAVLVSLNLGFTTSVNLLGARFDNVSIVAIAALSFAGGLVYSLFIYIGRFLHRRAKRGFANRDRDLAEREREPANRQDDAERAPEPSPPAGGGRSGLAKFLDFFKLRS